ncbi:MAG: carboxypeptidase-like regulatory domain-containing protein [Bacteroidales bacterium]|nr:carboxypeptidase-like regulatory domain-containing protein [Bacteroidales bacterium]
MKKIICIVSLLVCFGQITAQITVTGVVQNSQTKEPVLFTSVYVAGENIGTITNDKGAFSIYITDTTRHAQLTFSCIGYEKNTLKISDILNNRLILMNESVATLKEAEIIAFSQDRMATAVWKIANKYRTLTLEQPVKIFLSLQSFENKTEPLELIEAFYSGRANLKNGIQEMYIKNGRIGLNNKEGSFFFNLNYTTLLQRYRVFEKGNISGFPDAPFHLTSADQIKKEFRFTDNGITFDGNMPFREIAFANNKNTCSGIILLNDSLLTVKSVVVEYRDVKSKIFSPLHKKDKIDNLNLRFAYYYKPNEKENSQMILERVYLDYDCQYYSAALKKYRNIETGISLLCYDYERGFEPVLFGDTCLVNDYQRIMTIPFDENFWKINYFVAEDEQKNASVNFFENHGVLINYSQQTFQSFPAIQTPYKEWQSDVVLERSNFQNKANFQIVTGDRYDHSKAARSTDFPYFLDINLLLNYYNDHGKVGYSTKTLFNTHISFWLIQWDDIRKEYVNLYFDLCELTSRNMGKRLSDLPAYNEEAILKIYQEEMVNLRNRLKTFSRNTKNGTSKIDLDVWKENIQQALNE